MGLRVRAKGGGRSFMLLHCAYTPHQRRAFGRGDMQYTVSYSTFGSTTLKWDHKRPP